MNADTVETVGNTQATTPQGTSEMSAGASLGLIFWNPRKAFQALATMPRVIAPILLVSVCFLLIGLVYAQSGVLKSDVMAKMEAQGAPQERMDIVDKALDGPPKYFFALGNVVVALPIMLFVSAAILYFIANLMLGARLRYIHYLSIVAYSNVVGLVDHAAQLGLGLARGTLVVAMGIGAFLGDDLSRPLRALDVATDPLFLWQAIITVIGVCVMTRKSAGFGIIAVLPLFLARVVLFGFFA